MNIPAELRYTKTHEWVMDMGGGKARVGLTDHAQHELGDIVFVNLPDEGEYLEAGERLADVESVKAVSDIYSPAGGRVSAVNAALADEPAAINADPYGAWIAELEEVGEEELNGLLGAGDYEALLGEP